MIRQSTEEFRAFMRSTVAAGDPSVEAGAEISIVISDRRGPRTMAMGLAAASRRARIFSAITGESRADDSIALQPAELLIVRRLSVTEPRPPFVGQPLTMPMTFERIKIYLRALWDTEERRGMIEVARDEILTGAKDAPPSFTARMIAAEALPFAHPLLIELILKERRLLAGDRS